MVASQLSTELTSANLEYVNQAVYIFHGDRNAYRRYFQLVLCGLGLGSKPGLGLGFYGLGPLKSKARAGQEGSGRARAKPGLDPGLGRLATCGHMM